MTLYAEHANVHSVSTAITSRSSSMILSKCNQRTSVNTKLIQQLALRRTSKIRHPNHGRSNTWKKRRSKSSIDIISIGVDFVYYGSVFSRSPLFFFISITSHCQRATGRVPQRFELLARQGKKKEGRKREMRMPFFFGS